MMKIVLITDAWEPQVNGVVTTYNNIIKNLPSDVWCEVIHPNMFKKIQVPGYSEIQFALCSFCEMESILYTDITNRAYFHIATEGPLGIQAKRVLDKFDVPYTTAYHTKFPEFLYEIYKFPKFITKSYLNWFHKKSSLVFVASKSSQEENPQWKTLSIDRGYDHNFEPQERVNNEIPVLLYVGRVSKEKNIDAFCEIDIGPCKKIVVGDGPDKKRLEKKYKNVEFTGYMFASQLAMYYNMADVTVFPSMSDTFGVVILESMACGTPVAGYPVAGPIDQIENGVNGYMSEDLSFAVRKCLEINREKTRESVREKSWEKVAKKFYENIAYK